MAREEPGGGRIPAVLRREADAAGILGRGTASPSPTVPVTSPGLPATADMANKGPAYGMSRDVQSKIEKKYDDELEDRLVEWIVAQCGSDVGRPDRGRLGFQVWLKNGIVSGAGAGGRAGALHSAWASPASLRSGPQPPGEQPLPQRLQARQDPGRAAHHGVQADGADRPVPQGG